jgi:hypothetical protein
MDRWCARGESHPDFRHGEAACSLLHYARRESDRSVRAGRPLNAQLGRTLIAP